MKILQVNLGRSKRAHDMAFLTANEEGIDVIVASEPNKNIIKNNWITDTKGDVAILLRNRNIKISNIIKRPGLLTVTCEQFSIHGCYISPNINMEAYEKHIKDLIEVLQTNKKEAIVLGDFNAKATEWGSPTTDRRGQLLTEVICSRNMIIANNGNKPTFVRGESKSYIDITFSTNKIATQITKWEVLDNETLTEHAHIRFEIKERTEVLKKGGIREKIRMNIDKFKEQIRKEITGTDGMSTNPEECTKIIKKAYKLSTKNSKNTENYKPYWWNDYIEIQKRKCIEARRRHTRANKKNDTTTKQQTWETYKSEKKELQKQIELSKKAHWKKVCDELEADIWGKGYQIAMKQFKKMGPKLELTQEKELEIINALFPSRHTEWGEYNKIDNIEKFTIEEITNAGKNIKLGKAPGPDGIPPEAVKIITEMDPNYILNIMNELLKIQEFPKVWKTSKLVLITKPGKDNLNPESFRPLCLINVLGKFYEYLVKSRLEKELEEGNKLADSQYGFRKGRSTIQAIKKVISIAMEARNVTPKRKWCALITLDVRNAFNSTPWEIIIKNLKENKISEYIINIIKSYLTDRKIQTKARNEVGVTAGIPQGSVLGPILWGVFYDPVLRLRQEEGVSSIAFADDLALVITADFKHQLISKTNKALKNINGWMEQNDLKLAPEKTECVILSGRKERQNIVFEIADIKIKPSPALKYLGVMIDSSLTFRTHVNQVVKKAETKAAILTRILPNVGGPSWNKRLLINAVVQSTLLYAAPIWHKVLNIKKYKQQLEKTQRKTMLRIASGYRTTATVALQVVTGVIPIDLLIEERRYIDEVGNGHLEEVRAAARQRTLELWQERWNSNTEKGQWTKELIPNIKNWIECSHRKVEYFISQFMTGHGYFRTYSKRMGKTVSDNCSYCGEIDTPKHTIFECPRWHIQRQRTVTELGALVEAETLLQHMIKSQKNWAVGHRLIKEIMTTKEKEEREKKTES